MAILNIVKFGDELLRKRCRPVDEMTPKLKRLIDDMIETMRKADGCGLAAPQVGILRRIAVIEAQEGVVHVLVNPEIVRTEGEVEEVEGCLSNPGNWGYVKRPAKLTLRALDREGVPYEIEADGLLCRAICHECDHLDGRLYTDLQTKPYIPD